MEFEFINKDQIPPRKGGRGISKDTRELAEGIMSLSKDNALVSTLLSGKTHTAVKLASATTGMKFLVNERNGHIFISRK